jgi:hypothetical protein
VTVRGNAQEMGNSKPIADTDARDVPAGRSTPRLPARSLARPAESPTQPRRRRVLDIRRHRCPRAPSLGRSGDQPRSPQASAHSPGRTASRRTIRRRPARRGKSATRDWRSGAGTRTRPRSESGAIHSGQRERIRAKPIPRCLRGDGTGHHRLSATVALRLTPMNDPPFRRVSLEPTAGLEPATLHYEGRLAVEWKVVGDHVRHKVPANREMLVIASHHCLTRVVTPVYPSRTWQPALVNRVSRFPDRGPSASSLLRAGEQERRLAGESRSRFVHSESRRGAAGAPACRRSARKGFLGFSR